MSKRLMFSKFKILEKFSSKNTIFFNRELQINFTFHFSKVKIFELSIKNSELKYLQI